MNKKPARTGPKIRITRAALRLKKSDDPPLFQPRALDEHKYIYTCQYCRLKFTQNSQFFRHMTSNHESQQKQATYECNNCQVVFSKKANLDLHCQTHHQVKSKSRCESCSITFKSRHCLRRHMKLKQLMTENACLNCHKKFTNKDRLAKHVKNKHTFKNVTHQCDICSVKFKEKESLLNHLNRIHKKL
ncbi:zinc finger protein 782-like [Cydia amplana]|uniref:zinc finger protein 782-like n=1 Tax=Cydia amplana TaxID=1869771 RepID=UPI002FE5CC82